MQTDVSEVPPLFAIPIPAHANGWLNTLNEKPTGKRRNKWPYFGIWRKGDSWHPWPIAHPPKMSKNIFWIFNFDSFKPRIHHWPALGPKGGTPRSGLKKKGKRKILRIVLGNRSASKEVFWAFQNWEKSKRLGARIGVVLTSFMQFVFILAGQKPWLIRCYPYLNFRLV